MWLVCRLNGRGMSLWCQFMTEAIAWWLIRLTTRGKLDQRRVALVHACGA